MTVSALFTISFSLILAFSNAQLPTNIPTATPNYNLTYTIVGDSITFEVSGRTTGYIGFGFTNISGMVGSDIFIGGVYANGTAYFGDYSSYSAALPKYDTEQNWDLLDATETDGVTYVKFSRLLRTTDLEDIPIEDKLMNIIWSLGPASDLLQYHGFPRSTLSFNLISYTNGGIPPIPPPGRF